MIIEVMVEGEESPRRYRARRSNGDLFLWRQDGNGDTEPVRVDWRQPEPGVYSLLIEGHSYDAHVEVGDDDEEELAIHLLSRVVKARASDARKRRVARDAHGPDGTVRLTAPMPGKVVKVLAPEGTVVARGEGIIVLEAMKMENELKAPRDGTVTQIAVEEGQGVESGAHLATIE